MSSQRGIYEGNDYVHNKHGYGFGRCLFRQPLYSPYSFIFSPFSNEGGIMNSDEFLRLGAEKAKADNERAKGMIPDLEWLRDYCYQIQHEKYMASSDELIQFLNDLPEGNINIRFNKNN